MVRRLLDAGPGEAELAAKRPAAIRRKFSGHREKASAVAGVAG